MADATAIIDAIRTAFGGNAYPGDEQLQGSVEGREPFDAVGPFRGRTDWQALEPAFLDAHAQALHFFSQAALRFFLPAFLIADLLGQLRVADPLFPLTHGFSDGSARVPTRARVFVRRFGRSALLNPRRY